MVIQLSAESALQAMNFFLVYMYLTFTFITVI